MDGTTSNIRDDDKQQEEKPEVEADRQEEKDAEATDDDDAEVGSNDDEGEDDDDEDDDDDDDVSDVSLEEEKNQVMYFRDHYDEDALPECACRYCGIHDPASVAKCVDSAKWFCNSSTGSHSSHLIHHLVKSRSNQVQLHPNSPLGDTVLECYNCGSKNVFVLGFVPASTSSVVVLLCRVCVETVPALKDMDWNLGNWHPLIQDRKFLPWLLVEPNEKLQLKAREISVQQMTALEELWKSGQPDARYRDLATLHPSDDNEDGLDSEIQTVLKSYEDGYHYQNVLAPLVKMEADYDRQMKETLSEESIRVRWETSLANKPIAVFSFRHHNLMEQSRIVIGDELRLKLGVGATFVHSEWEAMGYVKNISDGEVVLELSTSNAKVPDTTEDFVVEYIWKSTSYDRMQHALKTFAIDDTSVTGYIYHKILGHAVADQIIAKPGADGASGGAAAVRGPELPPPPGLPPLNPSQAAAVRSVLESPLSLIQVRWIAGWVALL
jgi:regulator of nonsense transcripts 1